MAKPILPPLHPKSYREWIAEVEGLASVAMVWPYIDPNGSAILLTNLGNYPTFADYNVTFPANGVAYQTFAGSGLGNAPSYMALTVAQQKDCEKRVEYYTKEWEYIQFINFGIQQLQLAVFETARLYITRSRRSMPLRDILQSLQAKFGISDEVARQQLINKFHKLARRLFNELEVWVWVQEWENLYQEAADAHPDFFGRTEWVSQLLNAGKHMAPNFCRKALQGMQQGGAPPDFFGIVRQYREAVELYLSGQHINDHRNSNYRKNDHHRTDYRKTDYRKTNYRITDRHNNGNNNSDHHNSDYRITECHNNGHNNNGHNNNGHNNSDYHNSDHHNNDHHNSDDHNDDHRNSA